MPTIDEKVKNRLERLSWKEANSNHAYRPFRHELLGYGVSAIAHFFILQRARIEITQEGESLEYFCSKYQIKRGLTAKKLPLVSVEKRGIYVPRLAYFDWQGNLFEREVHLFSPDYINYFFTDFTDDRGYRNAQKVIKKGRSKEFFDLFSKPEFFDAGVNFSRDLWNKCVKNFEVGNSDEVEKSSSYFEGQTKREDVRFPPKKIVFLGRELIKYYQDVLSELEKGNLK